MLTLSAKIRKEMGRKVNSLREKSILPAVLYGPKLENLALKVDLEEFEKVYSKAGESSLIKLKIESCSPKNEDKKLKVREFLVLIHAIQKDPLTNKIIHIDFYQPSLKEKVEATVPLVFEGEAPAVKNLNGTLVKNISEIGVKALPQDLPHEIKVDIGKLESFEDNILVKDLDIPEGVEVLKEPEEIVALVSPPTKVEEELEKPVEEEIVEPEKIEKEKKEEKEEGEGEKKEEESKDV